MTACPASGWWMHPSCEHRPGVIVCPTCTHEAPAVSSPFAGKRVLVIKEHPWTS